MTIDLDEMLDKVSGWDLVVRIHGAECPVKAPTLAEMLLLERANTLKLSDLAGVMTGLLGPVAASLNGEQVTAILAVLMAYLGERSKKNGSDLREAAMRAVAE